MSLIHESVKGAGLSFHITKAVLREGKMVIKMTSSDTDKDLYGEFMSKELFDDFIAHIRANEGIPEPFASVILDGETWTGGMPYVSLAHYKSGTNNTNVPGEIIQIGRDGNVLKATAVLFDTPLGRAVFKSLQKDLVEKRDDKIRVSIGFLDLEHSHGEKFTFTRKSLADKCRLCKEGVGDKIYKKGHLVHLALTRVPANPRTDVEVERSMTTKREDAESIVDDEEVIKGLDLKSQAEEVLVVKTEDADEDEVKDGKKKKDEKMEEECSVAENPEPSQPSQPSQETPSIESQPVAAVEVVTPELSAVEKTIAALRERIVVVKSQGLSGDAALNELQADYAAVGETLKAEFTPPPSPEDVAKQNLESTLRSLLGEMLPQALAQTVAPIQSQLDTLQSELRTKSLVSPVASPAVPQKEEKVVTVQRSIQPPAQAQKEAIEKAAQKLSQFDLIARRSVGLTQ